MSEQNPLPPVKHGAVDTHCHLFLLHSEPSRVMETANAAGVETLVCVGIDPESSRRSLELADSLPGVFATAGMHPHDASKLDRPAGSTIEELLSNPRVVGVGETGLDFYRMHSPREDQVRAFRIHIELSRECGKPLVVHVRDAWREVLQLLDEGSAERVVLHCFSGDADTARECAARGYHLSFAGNITYPGNEDLRSVAETAPTDRLLVETDSPFLSPQSRRGRDNAPEHVVTVIEELARIRHQAVEDVRAATSTNAMHAFPGLR